MASRSFSWSRRKSSRHAKRALHFSRQQNRPLGFARLAIEALEERVLLSLGQPCSSRRSTRPAGWSANLSSRGPKFLGIQATG